MEDLATVCDSRGGFPMVAASDSILITGQEVRPMRLLNRSWPVTDDGAEKRIPAHVVTFNEEIHPCGDVPQFDQGTGAPGR